MNRKYDKIASCVITVLGNTRTNVTLTGVFDRADGFVSAGQVVPVGGGADHVGTTADQPVQDEGNKEDLQVRLSLANDLGIRYISITSLWIYLKETECHSEEEKEEKLLLTS